MRFDRVERKSMELTALEWPSIAPADEPLSRRYMFSSLASLMANLSHRNTRANVSRPSPHTAMRLLSGDQHKSASHQVFKQSTARSELTDRGFGHSAGDTRT